MKIIRQRIALALAGSVGALVIGVSLGASAPASPASAAPAASSGCYLLQDLRGNLVMKKHNGVVVLTTSSSAFTPLCTGNAVDSWIKIKIRHTKNCMTYSASLHEILSRSCAISGKALEWLVTYNLAEGWMDFSNQYADSHVRCKRHHYPYLTTAPRTGRPAGIGCSARGGTPTPDQVFTPTEQ